MKKLEIGLYEINSAFMERIFHRESGDQGRQIEEIQHRAIFIEEQNTIDWWRNFRSEFQAEFWEQV